MTTDARTPRKCPAHFGMQDLYCPHGCMENCVVLDPRKVNRELSACQAELSRLRQPVSREYPCGCILCICDDEERCHGCGAKSCGKSDAECDYKQGRIRRLRSGEMPEQPALLSMLLEIGKEINDCRQRLAMHFSGRTDWRKLESHTYMGQIDMALERVLIRLTTFAFEKLPIAAPQEPRQVGQCNEPTVAATYDPQQAASLKRTLQDLGEVALSAQLPLTREQVEGWYYCEIETLHPSDDFEGERLKLINGVYAMALTALAGREEGK